MESRLKELAYATPEFMDTLAACCTCDLPNFYLAGGAVTQLIWNSLLGNEPLSGIKDLDIVYFDSENDSGERTYPQAITEQLGHLIPIDVKNQANVHKWYPKKFGRTIEPYLSAQQGIQSWLPAFAIGLTLTQNAKLNVYAPYGLEDAFEFRVRPNKLVMNEASYNKITESYHSRWPQICVEPWGGC